ncbi:MAG: hypothetical protein QG578_1713 [Thermodesulfobacteriota bacterium]|nr:hypothetical protein [Thermodesulfobacteriota bacterium]
MVIYKDALCLVFKILRIIRVELKRYESGT